VAKTVVWGGGGCVASRGYDAGSRCYMATMVVGAGVRMCG
jgi:hypothetical protein